MATITATKEQAMTTEKIIEMTENGTIIAGKDKYGIYYIARPFGGRASCVTDRISSARSWIA
jgi:hypothetical protein